MRANRKYWLNFHGGAHMVWCQRSSTLEWGCVGIMLHQPQSPRYNKNIGGPTLKQIPFRLAEPDISALQWTPQAPRALRNPVASSTFQRLMWAMRAAGEVPSFCLCVAAPFFYIQLFVFQRNPNCARREEIGSEFVNTRNSQGKKRRLALKSEW